MGRAVAFVGKSDHLELRVNSKASFDEIMKEITQKMNATGNFFAGSPSIHVLGNLTDIQRDELSSLLQTGYGFQSVDFVKSLDDIKSISKKNILIENKSKYLDRKGNEKVFVQIEKDEDDFKMAADGYGMAMAPLPNGRKNSKIWQKESRFIPKDMGVLKQKPLQISSEVKNIHIASTLTVSETVRSGQSVAYDGDIIVLGDVNMGAQLIASGSITVLGIMRGMAHVGSAGDSTACLCATQLMPQQLRISEHLAIAPKEKVTQKVSRPERARLVEGRIIIEPIGTRNNQENLT